MAHGADVIITKPSHLPRCRPNFHVINHQVICHVIIAVHIISTSSATSSSWVGSHGLEAILWRFKIVMDYVNLWRSCWNVMQINLYASYISHTLLKTNMDTVLWRVLLSWIPFYDELLMICDEIWPSWITTFFVVAGPPNRWWWVVWGRWWCTIL